MNISKTLFAVIASMAAASTAPVLAQDPHGHEAPPPAVQPAAPADCPMVGQGMAPQSMRGAGMGSMQQGMMGSEQMQQMMQTMHQMRSEMVQLHKDIMQMRQDMQHGRAK